jgi:hypothetical protein
VGDGNNYAHWLLWNQGGKMINEDGTVGIDTEETRKGRADVGSALRLAARGDSLFFLR